MTDGGSKYYSSKGGGSMVLIRTQNRKQYLRGKRSCDDELHSWSGERKCHVCQKIEWLPENHTDNYSTLRTCIPSACTPAVLRPWSWLRTFKRLLRYGRVWNLIEKHLASQWKRKPMISLPALTLRSKILKGRESLFKEATVT